MSKMFSPPGGQNKNVLPRQPSASERATALLPGAKADAAARAGGGISPEFLQGLLQNQVGEPTDLGVLQNIRQSLGQGDESL
jgi:hypothetical protein